MADGECLDTSLVRLEDDGSLTTIEGWAGVYDGHAYPAPLVVSPEGDVWLIGDTTTGDWRADVLLRFDGTDWEVFPLPEGFESHPMDTALGFDPDGTLWVHAGGFVRHDAPDLVRFDDPRWSPFTVPGGTRSHVSGRDTLTIAPDGSFWLPGKSFDSGSPGVAHYDGTTATPYLVGSAPSDLAIAPDGSVWLYSEAGSQGHIYVITPGAVATREAEAIEPPRSRRRPTRRRQRPRSVICSRAWSPRRSSRGSTGWTTMACGTSPASTTPTSSLARTVASPPPAPAVRAPRQR